MLKAVSTVLVLAVSLTFVASLSAQVKERRHDGHKGGQPKFSRIDMMLRGVTLTDEQKTKVAALKKEYDPKLKEGMTKAESIVTPEQKKAGREAGEKARADGKKGKEAVEAVEAAMKLTTEQKTKMDEAKKKMLALDKELREKVMGLLTTEQKDQLKKAREEMRKHRPEPKEIN
jgi:Spy/CpxP family protein refolding chaperone